ncbi:regulator of G-protein signaling 7 [Tachysurus ichikawai]
MEDVIARMQDEKNGIPIRTVKSFLSKIPSVFSAWLVSGSSVGLLIASSLASIVLGELSLFDRILTPGLSLYFTLLETQSTKILETLS